jgi:hypothetical protein
MAVVRDALEAAVNERISVQQRAQQPAELGEHGGDRKSDEYQGVDNTLIERGSTNATYLTARIARDRPDILERMQAGEYTSVRAAAIEAWRGCHRKNDNP